MSQSQSQSQTLVDNSIELQVSVEEQHEKLIRLANMVKRFNQFRLSTDSVDLVFSQLVEHTQLHFECEETLLLQINHASYSSHKREHDEIRDRITHINKRRFGARYTLMKHSVDILLDHLSSET